MSVRARLRVVAIVMLPASALAQPAEHSIPWFEARPVERAGVLLACRGDHRLAGERPTRGVCANAESAETRAWANRRGSFFRELDSPRYWNSNPGRRAALHAACARRASYDAAMLRYCRFAE